MVTDLFKKLLREAWGDEYGHYRLIPRKPGLPKKGLLWSIADMVPPTQPEGYDLYWATASDHAPASQKHRKKDHSHVRIVWVDIDDSPGTAGSADSFPEPNYIINTSPGKAHFIYVLDQAVPVTADSIATIEALQTSLCELIGGDKASVDLGHVSRVPGSVNYKYDLEPHSDGTPVVYETTIYQRREEPYSLSELNPDAIGPGEHRHLRAVEALATAVRHGEDASDAMDRLDQVEFTEPLPPEERASLIEDAEGWDVAALAPDGSYADIPLWNPPDARMKPKISHYASAIEEAGVVVSKNLLGGQLVIDGSPLTDGEFAVLYQALMDKGYPTADKVRFALDALAEEGDPFNPVVHWIDQVRWDGQDRIGPLTKHFQADDTLPIFLKRWMIGAIARLLEVGGTQNRVLILEGPQGIGKSKFVEWLVPLHLRRYYSESILDASNKDHELLATRMWIWELAEIGSVVKRTDIDRLKAFITKGHTNERVPYGRFPIDEPFRASWIGTANNVSGLLTDGTGNRRYMAVRVDEIDWKSYVAEINLHQLWAQALHLYRHGKQWELSEDEAALAEEANESYMIEDPMVHEVERVIEITGEKDDYLTGNEILSAVGDVRGKSPQKLGNAMAALKVKKSRRRIDGRSRQVYVGVKLSE